ncbi:MAG: hypothetical protein IJW49_09580 [Clostridia bacterium]|nr:hypothetical protein [Clostridia bacterium]
MKRIFGLILLFLIVFTVFGCKAPTDSATPPTTDSENPPQVDPPTQAPAPSAMEIEDILEVYNEKGGYNIQHYDDSMIATIEGKLILDGEIKAIVHITKSPEWTYIYKFSIESDAIWLEENRNAFVASLENGSCIRDGKIVIYGNSDVIKTLIEE